RPDILDDHPSGLDLFPEKFDRWHEIAALNHLHELAHKGRAGIGFVMLIEEMLEAIEGQEQQLNTGRPTYILDKPLHIAPALGIPKLQRVVVLIQHIGGALAKRQLQGQPL
ncbi:hypothetical protein, partial [Pseudomonas indica]|uniref:hypothetical protein n=1 Tax=Pseudomonas indica TaxID=137658 RepID=UPI0015958806